MSRDANPALSSWHRPRPTRHSRRSKAETAAPAMRHFSDWICRRIRAAENSALPPAVPAPLRMASQSESLTSGLGIARPFCYWASPLSDEPDQTKTCSKERRMGIGDSEDSTAPLLVQSLLQWHCSRDLWHPVPRNHERESCPGNRNEELDCSRIERRGEERRGEERRRCGRSRRHRPKGQNVD